MVEGYFMKIEDKRFEISNLDLIWHMTGIFKLEEVLSIMS